MSVCVLVVRTKALEGLALEQKWYSGWEQCVTPPAAEEIHLPAGCSGGVNSPTILIEQNYLFICSCVTF